MYDSTIDAKAHINKIQFVIDNIIIPELIERSKNHDKSKLESPEKETYDKFIPLLQKVKYGTPEYNKLKDEMSETGVGHHYSVNRHHPEHFESGISDMTLIDIVEMFCDWYSASLRSDTGFTSGVSLNKERYDMSDQLTQIFINTYNEYLKNRTEEIKKI
jgi:hypothetical protein